MRSLTDQSELMTPATPAWRRPISRLTTSSMFSSPGSPVSQAERMASRMPLSCARFRAKRSLRVRSPSLMRSPLFKGSVKLAVPWQEKWTIAAFDSPDFTASIVALSCLRTVRSLKLSIAQLISRCELRRSWRGLSIARMESVKVRSAIALASVRLRSQTCPLLKDGWVFR